MYTNPSRPPVSFHRQWSQPNQHASTNPYLNSPNTTPVGVPAANALKLTLLNPSHPCISTLCIPGPRLNDLSVPATAPVPAAATLMPNICTVQLCVMSMDGGAVVSSLQESVREVRE